MGALTMIPRTHTHILLPLRPYEPFLCLPDRLWRSGSFFYNCDIADHKLDNLSALHAFYAGHNTCTSTFYLDLVCLEVSFHLVASFHLTSSCRLLVFAYPELNLVPHCSVIIILNRF